MRLRHSLHTLRAAITERRRNVRFRVIATLSRAGLATRWVSTACFIYYMIPHAQLAGARCPGLPSIHSGGLSTSVNVLTKAVGWQAWIGFELMNYLWDNVAIGGGGYVTGLVIHPREPGLVYIRTDIGGFYRWEEETGRWLPITDHFRYADRRFYGGEAIALDPNDPEVVYIAAGLNFQEGGIFRSADRGRSWIRSDLSTPMHGNGDLRWAGERLAVNPFGSREILFGSRAEGLFRSSDGGMTWRPLVAFGAAEDGIGILAVLFDPGLAGRVYANAYGDGLFVSDDGGESWSRLEGSPSRVLQMRMDADGTLFTTGRVAPKVARKRRGGQWEDLTPLKFRPDRSAPTSTQMVLGSFHFNGLSVDPRDSNHLIIGVDYKMPGRMYRTTDGGASWSAVGRLLDKTVPWWQDNYWGGSMASLVMDPHESGWVWFTDWFGVWRTENLTDEPPTWTVLGSGLEEIVATALLAPPSAATSSGSLLISGAMDICGLVHTDLRRFPTAKMDPVYQDTWAMDYCARHPSNLVRVGENRAMNFLGEYVVSTESDTFGGAISSDEGRSWRRFGTIPPVSDRPTSVAMSATDPRVILILTRESAWRTRDGGQTWRAIETLPSRSSISGSGPALAADRVNGEAFYCRWGDRLFRSVDGGISFSPTAADLPEPAGALKSVHGMEGEVWTASSAGGLFRSSDGGMSFTRIPNVDRVILFDLGRPPDGRALPTLFVYGEVACREGVFRSIDFGESWDEISPAGPLGLGCNPRVMTASWQRSGLVFIGTGGRGIFYGLPNPEG